MSLVDRAKERPTTRRLRRMECSISLLLRTLDPEEADALQSMLDDPHRLSSDIVDDLRAEGITVRGGYVQDNTMARHRRGACSCGSQEPA